MIHHESAVAAYLFGTVNCTERNLREALFFIRPIANSPNDATLSLESQRDVSSVENQANNILLGHFG